MLESWALWPFRCILGLHLWDYYGAGNRRRCLRCGRSWWWCPGANDGMGGWWEITPANDDEVAAAD